MNAPDWENAMIADTRRAETALARTRKALEEIAATCSDGDIRAQVRDLLPGQEPDEAPSILRQTLHMIAVADMHATASRAHARAAADLAAAP